MSATTVITCPSWCYESGDARHVESGMDHYDGAFRSTAATAGEPILLDGGAEFSLASVAVYQADAHARPYVDLDVSEVSGGSVEPKREACLRLRPDEARKLGEYLIAAAAVLDGA